MAAQLQNISDTALWVAVYRAMESERPDALFRDPYARRLAGPRGEEIARAIPRGMSLGWPMVVRTAVMDEIILRTIARDGVDGVVNLAAGLDTRPYRMPLAPDFRWIDVDLPGILAYKSEQLGGERPACRYEQVSVDLTDRDARRAFFTRVAAGRMLVLTEGLLVYLTSEDVASLAADLHSHTAFTRWLIDLASPRLLRMLKRTWGKHLSAAGSPMRFAPPDGTAFFEKFGWREAEFRSTWEESHRLKREMRFAWLWRLIGRLMPARLQDEYRRMSGIVLLERR